MKICRRFVFFAVCLGLVTGCAEDEIRARIEVRDRHAPSSEAKEVIAHYLMGDSNWVMEHSQGEALAKSSKENIGQIVKDLGLTSESRVWLTTSGYDTATAEGIHAFFTADVSVKVIDPVHSEWIANLTFRCSCSNLTGDYTNCRLKDFYVFKSAVERVKAKEAERLAQLRGEKKGGTSTPPVRKVIPANPPEVPYGRE